MRLKDQIILLQCLVVLMFLYAEMKKIVATVTKYRNAAIDQNCNMQSLFRVPVSHVVGLFLLFMTMLLIIE